MKKTTLQTIITSKQIRQCQPFLAFIFLPVMNLFALFLANPSRENISYIANTLGHHMYATSWALSCAIYLFVYTLRFAYTLHYHHRIGTWALLLSTMGMLFSVLIPYTPAMYPLLAKFHIHLSMVATLLYVLVMFHIMTSSYFSEPSLISSLMPFYITIVGSCLLLFLLMGCVSTILEVSFVIAMGFFLYACNTKTEKKE